jgi:hypothetical protein
MQSTEFGGSLRLKEGFAVSAIEETINATLDSNGELVLSHRPQLPAGPVVVTIRGGAHGPRRGLADVIRQIRADQAARGFHGLTTQELQQQEAELGAENDEYDREMEGLGALPAPGSRAG